MEQKAIPFTSLCETTLVVFVILKLTNLIDWSWWWVMSPMWIFICLVLFFFIFID